MGACLGGGKKPAKTEPKINNNNNKTEPVKKSPRNENNKPEEINKGGNETVGDNKPKEEKSNTKTKYIFDTPTARHDDIHDFYTFGKEIGRGGFSVVIEGLKKGGDEKYAIKCIKKSSIEGDDIKLLTREIQIMKNVRHDNILKLFEVFEDEEQFFLVMELVPGKELFDKIVERGQYSERDASNIARQIISAVEYLHEKGIAHRDLKPENLLSSGSEEAELIKIADFGFSKDFNEDKLQTSCGSPGYVAPEVLTSESYDKSVDMWSIGVIIYILLCGYPPFYADNAPALFKKIMDVKYDFDDPSWDEVSEDAKDLIRHLLVKNPDERYTAQQCKEHPWILGQGLSDKKLNPKIDKLKEHISDNKKLHEPKDDKKSSEDKDSSDDKNSSSEEN
eukprot:TRINITY_DN16972_c1_g1_i1.p1 TRINITY_DN16972_c1_g1~~TRINITY_DN16972_c1_g1_i1.p1  ORF type:complete len:392 (+),score=138.66 TRINITY_DN16972_c1_g1_i1:35-1210(+)